MTAAGRDPGLQAERTGLAWERTALTGLVGSALLLLRHPTASVLQLAAAAAGLAVVLVAAIAGARRTARLRRDLPYPPARPALVTLGGAVALFAALVIVGIVAG